LVNAAKMAAHLTYYFIWRKRSGEALDLATTLLEANQAHADAEVEALALLLRSTVQLWLSELESAYASVRRARVAIERTGVTTLPARFLFMLACCAVYAGDEAAAGPMLDDLTIAGEAALGPWPFAVVYQLRGILQSWQGKQILACESLGESVRRMRALGEPYGLCSPLHELGNVLNRLGKLDAAAAVHQECHETSKRVGHRWIELLSMYALAEVEAARGHLGPALDWYRNALNGFAQVGEPPGSDQARRLATIAARARRWDLVLRLHASADRTGRTTGAVYGGDEQRIEREVAQAVTALGATRAAALQQQGVALAHGAAIAQALDELLRAVDPAHVSEADQLEVRVLGHVEVVVGKRIVEQSQWKYTRSRDLLLYLLCRGGRATREDLGETFWPDVGAENQRNSLNVALHWLRRALGARDWVRFEADTYLIDNTRPIQCDLHEFERLACLAEAETARPLIALRRIEQALAMVRGTTLADVLDGSWHDQVRRGVQQRIESLRLRAGMLCLQLDLIQGAIQHYQIAFAANPLSEEACQGLMRAHAQQGELALLVRAYQTLHTALAEEMGVSPSAASRDLYRSLVEVLGGYSD
ncbi:MAG: AfsR/SARP family transcriptional regulator, partial [Caldilineaceae bacterium]